MMRKVMCLICVAALMLCATVLAERHTGGERLAVSANEEAQWPAEFSFDGAETEEEWRTHWEQAIASDGEAALGLSRGDGDDLWGFEPVDAALLENCFADFDWQSGWDGFGLDVDMTAESI